MALPGGWEFRGRHWNTRSRACELTNTGTGLKLPSCRLTGDLRIAGLRRLPAVQEENSASRHETFLWTLVAFRGIQTKTDYRRSYLLNATECDKCPQERFV